MNNCYLRRINVQTFLNFQQLFCSILQCATCCKNGKFLKQFWPENERKCFPFSLQLFHWRSGQNIPRILLLHPRHKKRVCFRIFLISKFIAEKEKLVCLQICYLQPYKFIEFQKTLLHWKPFDVITLVQSSNYYINQVIKKPKPEHLGLCQFDHLMIK